MASSSDGALHSLMDYTHHIVKNVLESEDGPRLIENARSKVSLRTMYSGLGSEGVALSWISQALQARGAVDSTWLRWHSACDTNANARKVLSACGDCGPSHVFCDIMDRHPPDVRHALDAVRWPGKVKKGAKRDSSGRVKTKQKCQPNDDEDCMVVGWRDEKGEREEFVDIASGVPEASSPILSTTLDAIYKSSTILKRPGAYGPTAKCMLHGGKQCPVTPQDGQKFGISLLTGGATCVDFSQIGDQAGFAGPSTKPFMSFQGTFAADGIDLGIVECAPQWDARLFGGGISDTHQLIPCEPQPCPSMLGWPFRRLRYYGLVMKKDKWSLVKSWQEFLTRFQQPVLIKGSDLFVDSPENVKKHLVQAVKRVGGTILPEESPSFESHGLTGVQATWLKVYREHHKEASMKKVRRCRKTPMAEDVTLASKDSQVFCDLEQNPDRVPRMAPAGMSVGLLTHGLIWSDDAERPMTSREILSLQAWPSIPEQHGDNFAIPWLGLVNDLSLETWTKLSGNGMHMHVIVLILVWTLSCCERITE